MLSVPRDLSEARTAIGKCQSSSSRAGFSDSSSFPLWNDSRLPRLPGYFHQRTSSFLSNTLRQSVLWDLCRRKLQEFDPLLIDTPIEDSIEIYSDSNDSWDALVDRLQAQIDRLGNSPVLDTNQFDRIGVTITALRTVNAERHKVWVERFFGRMKENCGEIPSLRSMVMDIEELQLACSRSSMLPARLREVLASLSNTIECNSTEYIKTNDIVREKESLLTALTSSISATSLQDRQKLRLREKACSDELNSLRLQLFEIESSLSDALNACRAALPETQHVDKINPTPQQQFVSTVSGIEQPVVSPTMQVTDTQPIPFLSAAVTEKLANDSFDLFSDDDVQLDSESGQQTTVTVEPPSVENPHTTFDLPDRTDLRIVKSAPVATQQLSPTEIVVPFEQATVDFGLDLDMTGEGLAEENSTASLRSTKETETLSSTAIPDSSLEVAEHADEDKEEKKSEVVQQTTVAEIKESVEQQPVDLFQSLTWATEKSEEKSFSLSLNTRLKTHEEPESQQYSVKTEMFDLELDREPFIRAKEPASNPLHLDEYEIEIPHIANEVSSVQVDSIENLEVRDTLTCSSQTLPQDNKIDSTTDFLFTSKGYPFNLLTKFTKTPALLSTEEWAALGHLQWSWLELRQPLRACVLADAIETNFPSYKTVNTLDQGEKFSPVVMYLPSWACRLLIRVSDPQVPWSVDEAESLTQIESLNDEYRELIVLWITASLFEGVTSKPLQAVRSITPDQYALQAGSLAHFCVEHILKPIHGTKDKSAAACDFEQAVKNARELVLPIYNNFQNPTAKSLWRKMTDTDGILGKILANTELRLFPSTTLMIEDDIKSTPEWTMIDSISRRDLQNRIDEFLRLIAIAHAAHNRSNAGASVEPLAISQQAVDLIINSIQHNGSNGWWLEAIIAGVSTL